MGRNRNSANLQDTPKACNIIMELAHAISDWKGIRVYLKMKECATSEKNASYDQKASLPTLSGQRGCKDHHMSVGVTLSRKVR